MKMNFVKPEGLIGRFAVVKLWPEIKTAEDECLARLKLAAQDLGLECIEVLSDGTYISDPSQKVSNENVDFVIHLHYDTPKNYDAFSFVALWNPTKFYFEWGYSRCSRNLTTHDDFLSCGSDAADDHVKRMIRSTYTHLPPKFKLYHSTPSIVHSPALGDQKLFYAGINWEAVSGGKSRHQEVLKRLDKTGDMRIYGPHIFQGVKVWAGYDSYVKEVPFDGISMVHEISKAGIALVLSSQAHKESALMSSRLFESIAAGAVIICDENPFAKKFFGNTLLYIDSRSTVEQMLNDIKKHLSWIHNNPDLAIAMAKQAQEIFCTEFNLIENLSSIYLGLTERKKELSIAKSDTSINVRLFALMPKFSIDTLKNHISSIIKQNYNKLSPAIVVNSDFSSEEKNFIKEKISAISIHVEIIEIDFFEKAIYENLRSGKKIGKVLLELINNHLNHDSFIVLAPNEKLHSNHISTLVGPIQRDLNIDCAATAAILLNKDEQIHSVHELLDFNFLNKFGPTGYGRFIFRTASIPKDIDIALPYLHGQPLAVLVGDKPIKQQLQASIEISIEHVFPDGALNNTAEKEIISTYNPSALDIKFGFGPKPIINNNYCHSYKLLRKLKLLKLLFSQRWIKAQLIALRKQGFMARFRVFKRKLRM